MPRATPLRVLSPIHKAARQVALYLEGKLDGRPASEGHLLAYLRSYAPCPVGELGRVFGLKGATLTGLLDRLESRGLVERQVDPADRRSFQVHLLPAGRSLADADNRLVRRFEQRVLARVSARDLQGFEALMAAIEHETRIEVRPQTSSQKEKS